MRRKKIASIGSLIHEWIDQDPEVQEHLMEVRAVEWFRNRYAALEQYITECYVRNGIMYISTGSAMVKKELEYQKRTLVAAINQELGYHLLKDLAIF